VLVARRREKIELIKPLESWDYDLSFDLRWLRYPRRAELGGPSVTNSWTADRSKTTLGPVPDGAVLREDLRVPFNVGLLFVGSKADLAKRFPAVQKAMGDPCALWLCWPKKASGVPTDLDAPYPGEVLITAPAGAAVIMNSSGWHSGTRKNGDAPRRLIHLSYTRRDLPQQLVQIDHLTKELYERMSPVHRYLLEIEPQREGVLRTPKRDAKGWWN